MVTENTYYSETDAPKAAAKTGDKDNTILRTIRDNIDASRASMSINHAHMREDIRFVNGADDDQWTQQACRGRKNRPKLTINRTASSVRQVVNDYRQNRISISISPADDNADPETAKVLQGLIRHIETNSSADLAYDTALENAAIAGLGYIRILTEYESEDSFNQQILIMPEFDPLTVSFDPNSIMPDGSDAEWASTGSWYSKKEFKRRWPNAKEVSFDDDSAWARNDEIRVEDYYQIERKSEKLHLLDDGTSKWESEYDKATDAPIVKTRDSHRKTVKWYQASGAEVLETYEWAGKFIPIVPVYGDLTWIDGKRMLKGMVRNAKDPARLYNYAVSGMVEHILKAPKAPYIAAGGQIEKYQGIWDSANQEDYAYLPYDPIDINGQALPPPQQVQQQGVPPALAQITAQAGEDIKAVTGIYDAGLGNTSNETSGKAILARQQQGATSNFHYVDNLRRAVRQVGRIILDLIPSIYDTPRIIRILGDDDSQKTVKINQPHEQKRNGAIEIVTHDLTIGRYDVVTSAGQAYATMRQQAAEAMMQVLQANPALTNVIGDLFFKALDWPEAQQIAERMKKMLPPNLQDAEGDQNPEVQAIMQQAQAQMQELQGALQQAQAELDSKDKELQVKYQIELLKVESAERIALIKGHDAEDLAKLKGQFDLFKQYLQSVMQLPPEMQYQDEGSPADPPPQPEQMMQPEPPQDGGFLMPDEQINPELLALNDGQIENNAPMAVDVPQDPELGQALPQG